MPQLNEQQQMGVTTTEGPVLILAGAGSGKTRVLTERIAYLIKERGVLPYNIMAITFTNKAAGEMRERVDGIVGEGAGDIWVATFHSSCVRILRRYGDLLGYQSGFSIYDTDDSKSTMKEVLKRLNIDPKKFPPKSFLNKISAAKNELRTPGNVADYAGSDPAEKQLARVYKLYQERLMEQNALDFDDLIMQTVLLFRSNPEVLKVYQDKFRYVMVDEYQDTNTAQFELVRLIASAHHNLCVVGDDDQSIYKFRGANIMNILNFEKYFPEATIIRLEQNYRSTKCILNAANSVIVNNDGRKSKTLWTENEEGEKINLKQFDSAYEEADFISSDIASCVRTGTYNYSDCAILYRTNMQSRILEEKFLYKNIPYRIVGGVNFYSRMEIKDILAYLKTIDNAMDDLAVMRIINVPKRGIGATTIARIADFAAMEQMSFYEALKNIDQAPDVGRSLNKIKEFVELIESFKDMKDSLSVPELLSTVTEESGYIRGLEAEGTDEAKARIENLDELLNKAIVYNRDNPEGGLVGFLEDVALIADIDQTDAGEDRVLLMTLHSAKGLEFPNVYLAGMEDGLFPGTMTIMSMDNADMEEERRLCYVGITRAEKRLTLTAARARMMRGETEYHSISRFVKEIDNNLINGEIWEPKKKESLVSDYKPKPKSPLNAQVYGKQFKEMTTGRQLKKETPDFVKGDRVRHVKFGEGVVEDIRDGGRDFEVTVEFDSVGKKKMFASFARLQKI